jgi:H+/Cl- antiporter ClcA
VVVSSLGMVQSCRSFRNEPTQQQLQGPGMKAYLKVTGIIFGLLGAVYIYRAFAEWNRLLATTWALPVTALIGAVSAGLSIWAWRLLTNRGRRAD